MVSVVAPCMEANLTLFCFCFSIKVSYNSLNILHTTLKMPNVCNAKKNALNTTRLSFIYFLNNIFILCISTTNRTPCDSIAEFLTFLLE